MPAPVFSPLQATRWLSQGLLGILYPLICEECGISVSSGTMLCADCMASIERADASEIATILQRLNDPAVTDIFALWHFEQGSTIRRLQHQLKYGNRPSIGNWFGRALGAAWRARGNATPDVVLPIPLHSTRLLERGYNQSTRICEGFVDTVQTTLDERALTRARATRSQTSLSRSRRQKNLEDVFRCGTDVRGLRILIVDDVLTTGATLNEAARTLLQAGAADVQAVAVGLAHT
jgi:ComF family protein